MSSSLQNSRPRNKNRQHNSSSRGSYQNANSYNRRETPEPEAPVGVYQDHRTAVMMCSIIGTQATVKTANGRTYKGRTTGFSDKGDIAMADAKLEEDGGTPGPSVPGIIIPKDSFVVCRTNGVDLKGFCTTTSDFTDSAIASRLNGSSDVHLRELQPWHDDDAEDITHSLTLEDNTGGWDSESMFQENYHRFNLKTSFDENMHEYTTRLPDPGTDAYEAKERFAKEKAEEIERDETYQRRIAKELTDNDDDSRFSFVHRDDSHSPQRSHDNNKNLPPLYPSRQAFPPLRGDRDRDRDDHLRNGNLHRGPGGRGGLHRQNSPYSSGGHTQQQQHSSHHHVHNNNVARPPVNNHYQQGPPPLNRNQAAAGGPPPRDMRQGPPPPAASSQHPAAHPAAQYHSQQQHIPPQSSQHRHPVVSPTQPPPQTGGKAPLNHLPPSSQQNVPSSSSSPVQNQQKGSSSSSSQQQPAHAPKPGQAPPPSQGINGISNTQLRQQPPMHLNGESGQSRSVEHHKSSTVAPMSEQHHASPQHSIPPPSTSVQQVPPGVSPPQPEAAHVPGPTPSAPPAKTAPSPPANAPAGGRGGRPSDASPDEARSKIADLQDFKEKFVLQEESVETVAPPAVAAPPTTPPDVSDQAQADTADKKDSDAAPSKSFKLNPNAKEFKPKAPLETQSPSPQPRSSPHVPQVVQYPAPSPVLVQLPHPQPGYAVMHQNPQRKRATVSLQANVDHLTHQVTGQPLLATQGPTMPHMMYIQGAPGAPLSAGYQIMGRMPNTLAMGQHGMDQSGAQNQPQHMFAFQWPLDLPSAHVEGAVPAPQQQPMPAHLPHPQPAHGQATMQPQQATPAHVPNPAPSPVHQQPPPQSVTPQPAHYINFGQHMPRTSMAGGGGAGNQQNNMYMSAGPQGYPAYQNAANGAQYAAQPQTSQNSSHPGQGGPQPQYVMMPQPQGHPPMQQHQGQAYPGAPGLQFHPQHNLMQGPPHMPPNHGPNPNQGAQHLLQHSMQAGLHQQMAGQQQGVFMSMPQTQQLFQHQQ